VIKTVVVCEVGNTAQCARLLKLSIASLSSLCKIDLNIVTYTNPWNSRWAADVCSNGEDILLLLSDRNVNYRGHNSPSVHPMPESGEIIHCYLRGLSIKFAILILGGMFIMNLYQLDKQSTKFNIWKYWKCCVKKLHGNDPNFLPTTQRSCITTMHLLTRHCLGGSF
jgi:hypothetical protein